MKIESSDTRKIKLCSKTHNGCGEKFGCYALVRHIFSNEHAESYKQFEQSKECACCPDSVGCDILERKLPLVATMCPACIKRHNKNARRLV